MQDSIEREYFFWLGASVDFFKSLVGSLWSTDGIRGGIYRNEASMQSADLTDGKSHESAGLSWEDKSDKQRTRSYTTVSIILIFFALGIME